MSSLDFGESESAIRINSIDTQFADDDLAAVFSSDTLPNALMVPKLENLDQVKWVGLIYIIKISKVSLISYLLNAYKS